VNRLIVMNPAASFSKIGYRFFAQMALFTILPKRRALDGMLSWLLGKRYTLDPAILEQFEAAVRGGRPRVRVYPAVLSDVELRSLRMPTLILCGEQEVVGNLRAGVERAKRLIRNCEVELIPEAGHLVAMERPEAVNDRMVRFLNQPAATTESATSLLPRLP